jgi:putative acetyltransferase
MLIRPETPADYDAIREINIAAFADHLYSQQTEHLIVDGLRAAGALSVSLVAEVDGNVVGHIAFSPAKIDGNDCMWFLLGPVGVLPAFQRRGIGTELINAGLKIIRGLGAHGCILVGDPAYYSRFGFRHIPELVMEGIPLENILSLPMTEPIAQGQVTHHAAFSIGR